jgi:hypothetical protein
MKKILSILLFSILSFTAFSQAGTDKILYENTAGTTAGAYTVDALKTYITAGLNSGTVTSVSVVSANGLGGTVATPSTTPAITLTTSVTGIAKGTGTGFVAAVAGSDYVIPSGSITGTASNVTGTVAVANGGTGATALTGYLVGNGTGAFTASSTIPTTALSGTLTNAQLANNSTTINGVARTLGASTTIDLASVTGQGATTATASTFSGGLISSGATTVSNQFNLTPSATSTGTTLTVSGTSPVIPVNATATTTVTVTAGITGNPVIELPLLNTSTGSVVINSSGAETFNGASTFTVTANSQNNTIKLRKISSTAWVASLTQ